MDFLHRVIFASDAELLGLYGLGFLAIAGFATLMEKRRMKTATLDRVGWMPWFGLFFVSVMIGGGLLAIAIPGLLKG